MVAAFDGGAISSDAVALLPSRDVQQAARTIGLQPAFATLARERPDALFVAGDTFFASRRVQFATLAARDRRPIAIDPSEIVIAFAGAAKKAAKAR